MACFIANRSEELAREIAGRFREASERAIRARGRFTCAVPGGSAARLVCSSLAPLALDWENVELFWGDERAVPPSHPDSNYSLARELLLGRVPIPRGNIHRMHADDEDLERGARAYESRMRSRLGEAGALDAIVLGMGPDGHVCSLFPGHPLLEETRRWVVAVEDSPKPPARRLSLSLPAILAAREVWFLVTGPEKAVAARDAIKDAASSSPAARVHREAQSVAWMLDRSAGALLNLRPSTRPPRRPAARRSTHKE